MEPNVEDLNDAIRSGDRATETETAASRGEKVVWGPTKFGDSERGSMVFKVNSKNQSCSSALTSLIRNLVDMILGTVINQEDHSRVFVSMNSQRMMATWRPNAGGLRSGWGWGCCFHRS